MKQYALGAAQRADLGERLDDPDLVVRSHDRHEERPLGDRRFEHSERYKAVRLNRQIGYHEAFTLERFTTFEHAFVLGLQGHDVIARLSALRMGAREMRNAL